MPLSHQSVYETVFRVYEEGKHTVWVLDPVTRQEKSVGFVVAAAFQNPAAVRLPKLSFPPERRALRAFLTNRAWMTAFTISGVSEGFFLVAAANAPISLVQPLLGTGLVVLAGFSVFYLKEKLGAGEWIGIFTLIAGLALLGASAEVGEVRGLEAISVRLV